MADLIKQCIVTKDDAGTIIQYDVSYDVEHGSTKNSFCVTIMAEELEDKTDSDEVKIKANLKAKAIKDAWIADLSTYTLENKPSILGEVSL
jgi:hypothetical protein